MNGSIHMVVFLGECCFVIHGTLLRSSSDFAPYGMVLYDMVLLLMM